MSSRVKWMSGLAAVALAIGLAVIPQAASAVTSSDGLPGGTWRQVCKDAYVQNDTLHASCRRQIGIYTSASARIGSCQAFGFHDGSLFCESGNTSASVGQWDGSFRNSCRDVSTDSRGMLTATCQASNGSWRRTSLASNQCSSYRAGNRDGTLVCETGNSGTAGQWSGSFRNSCRDVSVDKHGKLQATCRKDNGTYKRSNLQSFKCSSYRAGNRNGDLFCETGSSSGSVGQWNGSFRNSCRDASTDSRGTLTATCQAGNGSWRRTSLSSYQCNGYRAGNRDGNLFCESGDDDGATASRWDGSFRNSCRDVSMDSRGTLTATCQAANGSWRRTSLPSGQCSSYRAGNSDGNLVCETGSGSVSQWQGSFSRTCRDASVDSRGTLTATCESMNGNWNRSSLPSYQCDSRQAGNRDGTLFCER